MKKNTVLMHFFSKIFAHLQKMLYLCSVRTEESLRIFIKRLINLTIYYEQR